jgi:sugar phosphate isomerase/epimerase
VQFVKAWMDRAKACGASSLRANTGRGKAPFDVQRTGDSYRELAEHGKEIGVKALIENHGGYSADPENIVALVEHVDSPYCRSLPDFGNMSADHSWGEREAFLKKLLPYAHLISAKGMAFDELNRHTSYDVAACVRLAESCGFRGVYSIELWAPKGYYPANPIAAARSMMKTISENLM